MPRFALSTESAIKASRGAPRIPLPIRSVTRPKRTKGQPVATTTNALPTPASEYPEMTNGLLPNRSLAVPLINFVKPAAASAQPSMSPSANGAAPITPVKRIGSKGYKSSLAASWASETKVSRTKLRVNQVFII
ncbi:unannotated protein [freshwater metagenome]|uniref:Unannotated protein n=1 Tax=freshwater metagenome TaxID=449393 RepID=A0A6J6TVG7_9ZZZZ